MATICVWGHSLGVRIPKAVAMAAGMKAGIEVSVRLLDNGCLLVTPLHGKIVVEQDSVPKAKAHREEEW